MTEGGEDENAYAVVCEGLDLNSDDDDDLNFDNVESVKDDPCRQFMILNDDDDGKEMLVDVCCRVRNCLQVAKPVVDVKRVKCIALAAVAFFRLPLPRFYFSLLFSEERLGIK